MPRDASLANGSHDGTGLALSPPWRGALARVGAMLALVLAVFHRDWADMAGQWWNSSTYNHVLLVPAIVAWLVWQRRDQLLEIAPSTWWPPLVIVAGAALLWVLGTFAGVATARQLAVVVLMIAATIALLGPRVSAGLAFPLGYLLFLVPFGDELVPALQMITAAITIALVHVSGIPATINGVFIDTPVGLFEVAEACSGVKFLIAMIAFGTLVANVCFTSWSRRCVFIAASVIVPILANGVRAWGTIYAAQFFGVEVAAGFDHIVYGWVFFALVMGLLLAGSWRFFDRPSDAAMIDASALAGSPLLARLERFRIGSPAAIVAIALAIGASQAWASSGSALTAPLPHHVALPEVKGWQRVDFAPAVHWEPRATGAGHRLLGSYGDGAGHRVDVFVALYGTQREGSEPSGFGEGALPPESEWSWLASGPALGGGLSDRMLARGNVERLAVTWYRHGGLLTGSNAKLRLATMQDRLLLRARPTGLLIVSAEAGGEHPPAASIEAFLRDAGPPGAWVDRIAANR